MGLAGGSILRAVIHICTSHRTETLLGAFVERMTEERQRLGPLAPIRVVVPNRNVETYVRLGICERRGIAAAIETTFLRKFFAGLVAQAMPEARVFGAADIEGRLLALFHDQALLARVELVPVRDYLVAAGSERDAIDRRRCQIAAQLAQLFDEYASSRPDMLAAWARDESEGSSANAAMASLEIWQRALWRAIFAGAEGDGSGDSATNVQRESLSHLWQKAMVCTPPPFAGQTLHVFGLSYIATAYHRMLATLAQNSDVRIYALAPCQDWLTAEDHPAPLGAWARPGMENLRLLARLEGATVEGRFEPAPGPRRSLLHRVQDDIVNRRAPQPDASDQEADASIRVLPCPSIRRELEIVAAEIWSLARTDPTLRLSDVAVIVPETSKELYLAQISAVFAESCNLPHHVVDLSALGSHPAATAIELLIRLPFSNLSRKDFLPVLSHPCLRRRFPDATASGWSELAANLGIVRGFDRRDFAGSYVERDLFTWDQGLRRLALGALLDAGADDADGESAPLTLAGEPYLPGPAVASDDDASLGFGLLARSLLDDVRFASGTGQPPERPLREWLTFVRELVRSYVVIEPEDDAGQAVLRRFLAALDGFGENGLGDVPITYRIAAELSLRALGDLPWTRGSRGVTVATFVPMRAIPFRAVFLLGLGGGVFPRAARRSELDLRALSPQPGDVDRREQDLYMLLETLLSARDCIVLSYLGRDEITGEALPPSSIMLELKALLGRGYVATSALARVFGEDRSCWPPLHRHDDTPARREVLPAAESEARAVQLGREGEQTTTVISTEPADAAMQPSQHSPRVISIATLASFLIDPLQASARFRLRLSGDDDEESPDVTEEPLDLDKLLLSRLVSEAMADTLVRTPGAPALDALIASVRQHHLSLELAGLAPTGTLAAAHEKIVRPWIEFWQRDLAALLGDSPGCHFTVLAPAGQSRWLQDRRTKHQTALSFALNLGGEDTRQVRVEGRTGLWAEARGSTLRLAFRTGKGARDKLGRDLLRAFVDHIAVAASGEASEHGELRNRVFLRPTKGKSDVHEVAFRPISKQCARDYIERLCSDLLTGACDAHGAATGAHPYLLPHEAVLACNGKAELLRDQVARLRARLRDKNRDGFSSTQGPVPEAALRYDCPDEAEARRMMDARFGLFFELMVPGGKDAA